MGGTAAKSEGLVVDVADACLWRDGERIPLGPKAFEVLSLLVANAEQLVTKAQLLDAVWPDTHVTEAVLAVAVAQLREVLGDEARAPRFIETVHRRGYRWIGRLAGTRSRAAAQAPAPAYGGASTRTVAALPSSGASLVSPAPLGRDAELARLRLLLEEAARGDRRLVFVSGEPGIGKTTLVDALLDGARASGAWAVARGQCVDAYGAGEAYMPVLEALESLARGADGAVVLEVLRREAPTWLAQMPGLVERDEARELERRVASSTRERMIREVLRAFEVLAARRGLVLVLEDLHWSDQATVALLAALAARREGARLLVVATLRPVDAVAQMHPVVPLLRELVATRRAAEVLLDGLAPADIARKLDDEFAPHDFPPALAARLGEQTGGNPLFVEHVLDDLLADGRFAQESGRWRLAIPLEALGDIIPGNTRGMIERRLLQLPGGMLGLLEAAALVGVSFASQAVAAALDAPPGEVEAGLAQMVRDGVFVRGGAAERWPDGSTGARHAFAHALVRQVLEARVPVLRAASMHQRIADRIAAAWSTQPAEVAASLALHYERAGDLRSAVARRTEAAALAHQRNASVEAVGHLQRALELVARGDAGPGRDSAEAALHAAMLPPAFAAGGATSERFLSSARRIEELTAHAPMSPAALQAAWALMGYHTTRGEFSAGHAICERVLAACDGSPLGRMAAGVARGQRGFCRLMLADLAGAAGDLEASLGLPSLAAVAPIDQAVMARGNLGLACLLRGRVGEGLAHVEKAWEAASASGHAPTLSWAAATRIRAGLAAGRGDLVAGAARRAAEVAEQFAVDRWRALATVGEAAASGPGRDSAAAVAGARRALAEAGFRAFDLLHAAVEADLLLGAGLAAEAVATIDGALGAARCDASWWSAELEAVRGEALAAAGEVAAAREALQQAVAMARGQGAWWWVLRPATALLALELPTKEARAVRVALVEALGHVDDAGELARIARAREASTRNGWRN